MQVNSSIATPLPALLQVPHDPKVNPKASPKEAGTAFESMFASVLIKQMRQTLNSGQGLFGHDPSDVLGGLFDHFMGQHMAQHGSLGIAKLIEKHLEPQGVKK